MTLQSSGQISINDLVGEYGSTGSYRALSHYYKGGGLVANHSNNANVPTSGTIDLADFYGQSNTNPAPTSHSYSMTNGALSILIKGFDSTASYGSLSPNPQSTAFASGWNPTVQLISTTNLKGITFSFQISGAYSNQGWTSIVIPSGLTTSGSKLIT